MGVAEICYFMGWDYWTFFRQPPTFLKAVIQLKNHGIQRKSKN